MTTEPYTPDAARWDAFVAWGRLFFEWADFEDAERNYKLELGAALEAARQAFVAKTPNWPDLVEQAVGHPRNNLTGGGNWRLQSHFIRLLKDDPQLITKALDSVWAKADTPDRDRVRGFVEAVAPGNLGTAESMASFLLMAFDAEQQPFYRARPFNAAYKMTGYPGPRPNDPRDRRYEHAVEFLDEFMRQAADRDLDLRDRLDAQSLVWCVTTDNYKAKEWPAGVGEVLAKYRESGGDPGLDETAREDEPPPDGPDWPELAARLSWEPGHLDEIVTDLEDKRQMVFYGPPGTGKTFVAKAIAEEYARAGGGSEIVQFHPSYSYEDFVEGYRPTLDGDQAGFRLMEGPLKRIAADAAANPDAKFVLVIDELNRGNVAKVFGELYFLLEYRNEAMTLQYSDEPFKLPPNLLFICTMNTADRSIALVDAALRRRFWFHGFFPDEAPIDGLLRRWLAENQPGAEWVADLVDRANEHLGDRDAAIGPSYFMGDAKLDDERVRRIWRRAVRPYVEEQCYGEEEKLRSLEYDRLLAELNAGEPLPAEAPTSTEPGAGEEAAADGDDAS